jgi:glutaredoxin-like protein NrdH
MTRTVTIYTTTPCQQCRMTKKWLDDRGIDYTPIDANADEQTADAIRAIAADEGVKAEMPFVVVSNGDPETDMHWFGLNRDFLEKYTTTKEAA